MNHIEEQPKEINLSISWKDGRISYSDKPVSSRVVLRSISGSKSLMEVDIQMVVSSHEAETIYDALVDGKVFLEVNEAQ